MLDFQNTQKAFQLRSNQELKSAHFLFSSIANPALVKYGSKMALWSLSVGLPIKGIIRKTVFRQFCGGESIQNCRPVIESMIGMGVHSILDYSSEGKSGEADFEKTKGIILQTIEYALKNSGVPFAVFKPTGLGRSEIWTALSAGQSLSESEQKEWQRIQARIHDLCEAASKAELPILFDAEESWMQDAMDEICLEMMEKFNREKPIVYNTLQMYRHDRLEYLKKLDTIGEEKGIHIGLKIVRGAYMEKERARAKEKGYPSPIQPNKESTDRDYNAACDYILNRLDRFALVAGTHNEESAIQLATKLEEVKVDKTNSRVYFSQLYGMSDHISFNLADAGFNVVKYLPFGPINEVMPYLIRRAEENTSVEGQSGRELQLITKELKRRKKRS